FFFQAEDGIRDGHVTGVQTCALPISPLRLVILVDQFEEVFTQCSDASARQALIDNLMAAANEPHGQTIIVMTLRADLYGECSARSEERRVGKERRSR